MHSAWSGSTWEVYVYMVQILPQNSINLCAQRHGGLCPCGIGLTIVKEIPSEDE
jgi:hypothetical protein